MNEPPPAPAESQWLRRARLLADLLSRQIFFIGACPRSGTTWLQLQLDAHPDISCRGEAHFLDGLAPGLVRTLRDYNALLARKHRVFAETETYLPVEAPELRFLLATAILLRLDTQRRAKPHARAVGEKTPDNLFAFPQLRQLLPEAKFINLVRDPRDVLVSIWHHNARLDPRWAETKELQAFARQAVSVVERNLRAGDAFVEAFPQSCLTLSYEQMTASPEATAARLFGFLGVSAAAEVVTAAVAAATFERLSGGRARGQAAPGSHFRRGVVGGWRDELTTETARDVRDRLGWAFERHGWAET